MRRDSSVPADYNNAPLPPPLLDGNESSIKDAPKKSVCGRMFFLAGGWGCLFLAWIGVFIPILPTAPFVVFASFCFGYANPRMRERLEQSEYFGELIRNYRTKEGISQKTKTRALIWLYLTLGVSLYFTSNPSVQVVLLSVAFFVSLHICSMCRSD